MSNNEKNLQVETESDDGHKKRWYQGVFYRKIGKKFVFHTEKAKYFIVATVSLILIGHLFAPQDRKTQQKVEGIERPTRLSAFQPEIQLNSYSDTKVDKKTVKPRKVRVDRLSLVSSKSKISIPLGASAKGVLVTGASNGPVKVQLTEDLISHGETFIKEGSILWGKGASTDERLMVSFSKFVDKNGKTHEIKANAFDISDQILGLKGSIIGRTSKKILAGAGLGVAGALQTMQQSENLGGVAVVKPNLKNALLNGASGAALGIAEQELEELKNKQTIIEVKKGTKILIVFGGV